MPSPPDLTAASDRDVVRLARQGREDGYRELVRRYRRPVLARIFDIVRHRERAQDLAQETFVKAFDTLHRYRSERRFAPWLFTVARNAARNYIQKVRPDSAISPHGAAPRYIDHAAIGVPAPGETPTPVPAARPLDATVDLALRRLRPEFRRCVTLRFLEGRSYREIAAIMRLPVGTVKSHLTRARRQMKKFLESAPA